MKKSELYREAMKSVMMSPYIESADEAIDIIQLLMHDYELAVFEEEKEETDNV